MVWQKFGYQDAAEYDPERNVVRYGTYEFHAKDAGLTTSSYQGRTQDEAMNAWKTQATQQLMDKKKQSYKENPFSNEAIASTLYGPQLSITEMASLAAKQPVVIGQKDLGNGMFEFVMSDKSVNDYDFVNRLSSMANALSAKSGGDLGDQRPRRRTATGAF